MMNTDYRDFLEAKAQLGGEHGFDPVWMPDFLFDFQQSLTTWALRKGRAAIFADCGLGKTPMGLVWAENIVRKTGRPVLIVTPLAVSHQFVREGEKFGVEVRRSDDGTIRPGINVTNYERLHLFSPADVVGTYCDESSAIKAFNGRRREIVNDFMLKHEYRLMATATAAPNDWYELGTTSEALGELARTDMLARFFKNEENSTVVHAAAKWVGQRTDARRELGWRLKGHAVVPFWRWVASWARAIRKPSDIGFDDTRFILPELRVLEHLITDIPPAQGMLFTLPAIGLGEQRDEMRRTLVERCERVAELVNNTGKPAIVWCHLNDEGDTLEGLIPDAVQVSGADSDDYKENAMADFIEGRTRILISKPRIFGWGINLQHCNHMTFFPSHSYEAYYQAVRRCWRFGQTQPVTVDIVTTEGGRDIMQNLQAKDKKADQMFDSLIREMNSALNIAREEYAPLTMEVPSWLTTIN